MAEIASLVPSSILDNAIPKGRPVTAYIKPSDYCNVGCDHCYLPLSVRANKYRMNEETLDNAIRSIDAMATRQRAAGIVVIWHGGEPLALPVEYLSQACGRVRSALPGAAQTVQTSLIPYRSAWAPVIHEYFGGHIGSSIDFSQRTIKGDVEKFHDLWMSKVQLARTEGCFIIPGMVPSKNEIGRGRAIATWMQERGFFEWNIDRYNSFGKDDPMRPRNVEHSAFLTEVFDAVMDQARAGVFTRVNTVMAALGGVLANRPGDRWGGSCSMDFLVVNPDGSTSACPDKISYETFSNINDGYDVFASSKARKDWIRMHIAGHRNPDCPTCPFNTFCKSGCPLTPNAPKTEGECSGYHRHLRHVRDFAAENAKLIETYLHGIAK